MSEINEFEMSDGVPDIINCPDKCVEKAIKAAEAVVIRKVTVDDEVYINLEELADVFLTLGNVQIEVMKHTPNLPEAMARMVGAGMFGLASNVGAVLHSEQVVEATAPDIIPADWTK